MVGTAVPCIQYARLTTSAVLGLKKVIGSYFRVDGNAAIARRLRAAQLMGGSNAAARSN